MTIICKLEFLGDAVTIARRDGTSCYKQQLNLRELGGKFSNTYCATLFGDKICTLREGTWLACELRFSTHRFESSDYQDVTIQEYVVLQNTFPVLPNLPPRPVA